MKRRPLFLALVAVFALQVAIARAATNVVIQGTTDVRDAGLLDDIIKPGFQAAYPQYTLQYIAVGTGAALANAQAGGGDGVLTHAPTLEAQFVANGYSADPFGRAIFYSDYVVVGPKASDPAGIFTAGASADAVRSFELIAAAGAAGHADFVSRGDNSGTNVEEKQIWALTTGVELNTNGEPGPAGTTTLASWYHKGGLGQAATVQLADQCTFSSGACYDITDRGTFNRLVKLGTVTHLKLVAQKNRATARGGLNLLTNSFHYYVVNAHKVGVTLNTVGARAFGDYLVSAAFQARLASYPTKTDQAFFADARPAISIGTSSAAVTAGAKLRLAGTVASRLPGASPLNGPKLTLFRHDGARLTPLATTTASSKGAYAFTLRPTRNARYEVASAVFHDLQAAKADSRLVAVQAVAGLARARVLGPRRVRLTGTYAPLSDHGAAQLRIYGRRGKQRVYGLLAVIKLGHTTSGRYATTLELHSGRWHVFVVYADVGVVLRGSSRTRAFAV